MTTQDSYLHPGGGGLDAAALGSVVPVEEAGRLAGLLGLLADPVRSRVLFALVAVDRLCVGDLALVLGVCEDSVSYGLKLLRTAGLVAFAEEGRGVYYSLGEAVPRPLLEHCLRRLVAISAGQEASR